MNIKLVINTNIEHIAKSIPSNYAEEAIKEIVECNDDIGMKMRLAAYFNELVDEHKETYGEPAPWMVRSAA